MSKLPDIVYISVDIMFIVSHLCFTYVKIEDEKKRKENWTLIVCCKDDHPHTHRAEWKNRCKTNKQTKRRGGGKGWDMCKIYRSGIRKRIVFNNWTKKKLYIYITDNTQTHMIIRQQRKSISIWISKKNERKRHRCYVEEERVYAIYILTINGTLFEIGQWEEFVDLEKAKWFFNICLFPIG